MFMMIVFFWDPTVQTFSKVSENKLEIRHFIGFLLPVSADLCRHFRHFGAVVSKETIFGYSWAFAKKCSHNFHKIDLGFSGDSPLLCVPVPQIQPDPTIPRYYWWVNIKDLQLPIWNQYFTYTDCGEECWFHNPSPICENLCTVGICRLY